MTATDIQPPRSRTALRAAALVLALAAGAGAWAGRATLVSPIDDHTAPDAAAEVWATASPASVGRTLPVATTVRQPVAVVAQNALAGVVTSIEPGTADQGTVVYTVGNTPVRVVRADTPFWRALTHGTRGEDVHALQQALVDLGHLAVEPDGVFGAATTRAVGAWQRELGLTVTGSIPFGELVALPTLPTEVRLGEALQPGLQVSGGEDAVLAATGVREFVMIVSEDQARLIPHGATVRVTYETTTWEAVVAEVEPRDYDTVLWLTAPVGGDVCADSCAALPTDPSLSLRSEVVLVEPSTGIGVPAAAVRSRADMTTFVVTRSGEVDVAVVGSGQGVAILDGLADGTEVLLPSPGQGEA